MRKGVKYQYFVEGKCEEKLIKVLKKQKDQIISGKVEVLNVVQERLTDTKLRLITPDTIIILIFDTDTGEVEILKENLKKLEKWGIKKVWCVVQVKNLEDEILRATSLRNVKDLFKCKNLDEFKEQFIKEKNLYKKLTDKDFDLDKMWITEPPKEYCWLNNDGNKIKRNKV